LEGQGTLGSRLGGLAEASDVSRHTRLVQTVAKAPFGSLGGAQADAERRGRGVLSRLRDALAGR
jgi:hypothetical protein